MRTERNKFFSTFIYSKITFLALFVFLIILVFGFAKTTIARYRVQQDIGAIKQEIRSLEGKNTEFSDLLTYLQGDEFVKQEGRVKYGLREEGERLVVVNNGQDAQRQVPLEEAKQDLSNAQKWFKYFFR